MAQKLRAGILGATGMVGQRFVTLLHNHPQFEIVVVAASAQSAGKTYSAAVSGRWAFGEAIPASVAALVVKNASEVAEIAALVDIVFCAVDMPKAETLALEEAYAKAEIPVISNNSAARAVPDVPMLIPEINAAHCDVISLQRKRLGTTRGFIAVKSNCSLQSYLPPVAALLPWKPTQVLACTYQAISGAGKTFATWPDMVDNVIPLIKGEEEKSEKEPLKILGRIGASGIEPAPGPVFSAQCVRVPASDGHMAAVHVNFEKKPSRAEILAAWKNEDNEALRLGLHSAPRPFLTYFEEEDRPQTRLDRDLHGGMGISMGRLREDTIFDWKFICLSHNTLRGAAGGAVLMAELLVAKGFV